MFPPTIPTTKLRLTDVPPANADYTTIGRFALTFDPQEDDPYKLGRYELSELTNDTSLTRLRSRLFLEQRSWNHIGNYPDEITMAEIRKVIELIRAKLLDRGPEVETP